MAFMSSSNKNPSSTNGAVNTAHGVFSASTQVNAANSINIDNLSDAVICAFLANPKLVHKDLEQIHPDDLEEMNLRWQIAMLTMRARRFLKKIGRKLTVNEDGPNHALMAFTSINSDLKNMVPRAALMKSSLVSVNTARQVNTAHPKSTVNAAKPMLHLSKTAHSIVKRPIHKKITFENSKVNQQGNPQMDLQDKRMIDSRCSRHMTGNMSYLIDYEEIDEGYVAFVENPKGKKIIGKGTKWVFRNKKDEKGIIIKNKERLVAQGHIQEERIDYDEVFAPVARIEAVRLFLAYASFKDFMVYQMDVKSAFHYGKIENRLNQKNDGIFISQNKHVAKILKKFGFIEVKNASTPMETQKPLLKDEDGKEVDIYMYRSMIGSLMYLTSSRRDIMFALCAYVRYQVNPKVSHLYAVKKIFRYLKGHPKLSLWYLKESPFDLVGYTDSDYVRASLDMKSTTRGCQYLGCRLISWQCKNRQWLQILQQKLNMWLLQVDVDKCYGFKINT
nr:ribonuclease H-like domain, reverse transcriptase, RNA-dependent DNA polymerase [Tanacetum cinerariifolium]